jgi:hypothetical protein
MRCARAKRSVRSLVEELPLDAPLLVECRLCPRRPLRRQRNDGDLRLEHRLREACFLYDTVVHFKLDAVDPFGGHPADLVVVERDLALGVEPRDDRCSRGIGYDRNTPPGAPTRRRSPVHVGADEGDPTSGDSIAAAIHATVVIDSPSNAS